MYAELVEPLFDGADKTGDEPFTFRCPFGEFLDDVRILFGLEVSQGEVLHFGFDGVEPQFVGQLGVEVQGLPRFFVAFDLGEALQRPHHLQSVGHLNQDDARVGRVGYDKFSEIVGLQGRGLGVYLRDVVEPFDNGFAGCSILRSDLFEGHQAESGHVVQQG